MSKSVIAVPTFPPVPQKMSQHFRGWVEILRYTLKDLTGHEVVISDTRDDFWDWDDDRLNSIDTLYLYHGINYLGESRKMPVNLWGGITPEHADELVKRFKIIRELHSQGKVQSLEYVCPDYSYSLGHKANQLEEGNELGRAIPWIKDVCDDIPTFEIWKDALSRSRTLCIGDSHVGACWRPGAIALRNDRKTLNGVLNYGLEKFIRDRLGINEKTDVPTVIDHGVFHFGNIDIRHHLCRLFNSEEKIKAECIRLIYELHRQVSSLGLKQVTLVEPYPIEHVSRKVTKSVMYEDQPFWGTWAQRDFARRVIIDEIRNIADTFDHFDTISWDPAVFCNGNGELKFECMEKPRSIHLSPEYYYWDLVKNERNQYGESSCGTLDSFLS